MPLKEGSVPHVTIVANFSEVPCATSCFTRFWTNPYTTFCRIISAFLGHASPGAGTHPSAFRDAVVPLRLSCHIDCATWFRRLRHDSCAMGGTKRKVQPGFGTWIVRTGLRRVCRVQLLADAVDPFRPFFRGGGSSPVLLYADLPSVGVAPFFLFGTSDFVITYTRPERD